MSEESVERTLGLLLGSLKAIEDRLERADESRASIHRRLDEVVMRTTHLEADMTSVKKKTDAIQSVTNDVVTLRNQAQGAGTLGRWLIRIGIGVVGAAGWLISVYTYLTGKPPP